MENSCLWKGLVAGAVGGLVGTVVMTQFQNAVAALSGNSDGNGDEHGQRREPERQSDDPATVRAAQAIAKSVTGNSIPAQRREMAGQAVHYAMGMVTGAVYGMMRERAAEPRTGAGLLFGGGVWAIADEIAAPAMRLSDGPYPVSTHANALAAHLVYGATTAAVTAELRALL